MSSATEVPFVIHIPRQYVCYRCDGRGYLVLRFSDRIIPWRCPACSKGRPTHEAPSPTGPAV